MNKIVCKLNEIDDFTTDEVLFEVNLTTKADYHLTFYRYYRRLYQLPSFFSNEALDLFYISLMVFFADRKVSRKETNDAWTREFRMYIPVLEYDKWISNKLLLEEMISFLSGDSWQFEFRKRGLNDEEVKVSKGIKKSRTKLSPDAFCMLSGGLDSFIGAIDLLKMNKFIAFVSHYGGGKGVREYQSSLQSELIKKYGLKVNHFFNFHAAPIGGIEDTTRTRSFMFFAHAIILASTIEKPIDLFIPENGLISLNIPLTNTRLGSSSTRTTHPYYIKLLQQLLCNLDLNITLKNPYQFATKGEMIINCGDSDFLANHIYKTMSCSHPDNDWKLRSQKPTHCGYCLPCVIRRAAIEHAYGQDNSAYRITSFNKGNIAALELKSYKIGLLDFNESLNDISFKIQEAGSINKNIEDYNSLYLRGMKELEKLLKRY